ncbi:MAG: divergent polysaccharide deacetylase family protein [Proteobacteria bacterium]|nr:divergent polysaccharide deacetylase family protein [Pseudomonadota bacterium]
MKKILIPLITLAIVIAGVFYFVSEKSKKDQPQVGPVKDYKKDDSLNLLVNNILKELEEKQIIRVVREGNDTFIETDTRDIENIINSSKTAKEKGIVAVKTNDFILFKRDNETFTVKFIIPKEKSPSLPKLAIVIDDIGNSKESGEELFSIKGLTYSILPNLPYSMYFLELGKKEGKDLMLHIPMEPKDMDKYGKDDNLLRVSMSSDEIVNRTQNFINSLPDIKGVNNHMGSKFTESEEKMRVFLAEIKKKKLFYLDSRTSPDSKGYEIAKEIGVKSFKRDIFLDHEIDEIKIAEQIDKAVEMAIKNGFAIAIGHPHKETIKVLKEKLPKISKTVEITPLSKLR